MDVVRALTINLLKLNKDKLDIFIVLGRPYEKDSIELCKGMAKRASTARNLWIIIGSILAIAQPVKMCGDIYLLIQVDKVYTTIHYPMRLKSPCSGHK